MKRPPLQSSFLISRILQATCSIHQGVVQFWAFSARSGPHVQYSFKTTPAPSPIKAPKLTSLPLISHADVTSFQIVGEREFIHQSLVRNNTFCSLLLTLEFSALGNVDTNLAKMPVDFAVCSKQGLWASRWDVRCQTEPQWPAAASVFMKDTARLSGMRFNVWMALSFYLPLWAFDWCQRDRMLADAPFGCWFDASVNGNGLVRASDYV